jgi:hypothetical protein
VVTRFAVIAAALTALAALAGYILLLTTRMGILVRSELYMQSEALGVEFDPATSPRDVPFGRVCLYITHAGLSQVALIERRRWGAIARAQGDHRDPKLRHAWFIEYWTESECELSYDFTERIVI